MPLIEFHQGFGWVSRRLKRGFLDVMNSVSVAILSIYLGSFMHGSGSAGVVMVSACNSG